MTPKGRFIPRTSPRGASPGILKVDPDAHPSSMHVMSYGPDQLDEYDSALSEHVEEAAGKLPVTWINVVGLGNVEVLGFLRDRFGLHDLAMEDVVNIGQRPKGGGVRRLLLHRDPDAHGEPRTAHGAGEACFWGRGSSSPSRNSPETVSIR